MSSEQRIEATSIATSDKCIYTWTIKNYSLIKLKPGESIESPKFGVGSDNKNYFKLKLHPEGNTKENKEFIALFLHPVIDLTQKPDKLICRSTISIINNEEVVTKSSFHYDFMTSPTTGTGYGWRKFYELEHIENLISSEDSVTVQCELEVFNELKSSLSSETIYTKDETIDRIKFDSSFLSEKLSDVKITTSDKTEIPAHKVILAAVSPVFRAMFTHDMLENKDNSVTITDTTEDILTEMLRYIYTGMVGDIDTDEILELLEVADKYQIDQLKIKCGKMLCAELSSQNAIEILIAAHKYKVKYLKDEVIKFITTHIQLFSNCKNMKEIDDPEIWINLIQSITMSQKNVP